jgi:hypothetical protein
MMDQIGSAIKSLTSLEVVLFFTTIFVGYMYIAKLYAIEALHIRVNDLQVMNNRLYVMYMELSNSSTDIVQKWQKSIDNNKDLTDSILKK